MSSIAFDRSWAVIADTARNPPLEGWKQHLETYAESTAPREYCVSVATLDPAVWLETCLAPQR